MPTFITIFLYFSKTQVKIHAIVLAKGFIEDLGEGNVYLDLKGFYATEEGSTYWEIVDFNRNITNIKFSY